MRRYANNWGLGDADPVAVAADAAVENEAIALERETEQVDVSPQQWMIPSPLATQVFSIVPGIAGGLAGFILAQKLSNAKEVKAAEVLFAAGTVAAVTFGAVFLIRTVREFTE